MNKEAVPWKNVYISIISKQLEMFFFPAGCSLQLSSGFWFACVHVPFIWFAFWEPSHCLSVMWVNTHKKQMLKYSQEENVK